MFHLNALSAKVLADELHRIRKLFDLVGGHRDADPVRIAGGIEPAEGMHHHFARPLAQDGEAVAVVSRRESVEGDADAAFWSSRSTPFLAAEADGSASPSSAARARAYSSDPVITCQLALGSPPP